MGRLPSFIVFLSAHENDNESRRESFERFTVPEERLPRSMGKIGIP